MNGLQSPAPTNGHYEWHTPPLSWPITAARDVDLGRGGVLPRAEVCLEPVSAYWRPQQQRNRHRRPGNPTTQVSDHFRRPLNPTTQTTTEDPAIPLLRPPQKTPQSHYSDRHRRPRNSTTQTTTEDPTIPPLRPPQKTPQFHYSADHFRRPHNPTTQTTTENPTILLLRTQQKTPQSHHSDRHRRAPETTIFRVQVATVEPLRLQHS